MGIRISLFLLGFFWGGSEITNLTIKNKKKILKTSRTSHFIRYKLPISDFVQIGTPYFSLEDVVYAMLESGHQGKFLECYQFHFSFYV